MFRIGEFAKLSGTTVKRLRFYDEIALLRPAEVDSSSGYRYYSAEQLDQLSLIQRLKTLGVSLADIRGLLRRNPGADGKILHALLADRRRELVRQLSDEEERLAHLDRWLAHLEGTNRAPSHAIGLKQIETHTTASIRQSLSCYSGATELFDELGHYVNRRQRTRGPAAAIWHSCDKPGRRIDCEVFLVTQAGVRGSARVRVAGHPSCLAACVVHRGPIPTDAVSGPYAAVREWIRTHSFRIAGPMRELYWQGTVDQELDSDVTEIQFPVVRA